MILIFLFLLLGAADAAKSPAAAPTPAASKETVALVELFIKTKTGDLPVEKIPDFIAVDDKQLPKKLRKPYLTKRSELLALKKISDGKKSPYFRRMGKEEAKCAGPQEDADAATILRQSGFEEVAESEIRQVMRDTRCSECELEEEFTLKRVLVKSKPSDRLLYFVHSRDPLMAIIGSYRGGKKPFGTNFFGTGGPSCR